MPIMSESSLVYQFQWQVNDISTTEKTATIISNMISFRGVKSFRVGLKNRASSSPTLFLITTNLNKMGVDVFGVKYSFQNSDRELMSNEKKCNEKEEGESKIIKDSPIQLFTSLLQEITSASKLNFTFYVFIKSAIEDYDMQQVDSLLKEQFWSSAVNRNLTDFELNVDGRCFPVHKFVLAARSPVFATLFEDESLKSPTEAITTIQRIAPVDAECMELFLKFIYTGELDGIATKDLLKLASFYQIETLEKICQDATASYINCDQMATLALCLNAEDRSSSIEIKPGNDVVTDVLLTGTILTCTWKLKWTKEGHLENSATSTAFEYSGDKLFRVEIKTSERSAGSKKGKFTLTFISYNHHQIGLRIDEVGYGCCPINSITPKSPFMVMKEMKKKQPNHGTILQTFTSSTECSTSFDIIFIITLSNTVKNYGHKLVDWYCKDQLWTASTDGQLTDVELLVGKSTFTAHRALLSARSPVFAAMFKSGMEETQTGRVRVDGVDPTTFRQFLEFLYTGTLSTWADKEKMSVMADRYQVETLVNLCKLFTLSPLDIDQFTEIFLS